jgi:dTDP-3,4-didehydro-2,6-dideoxy-alpha-D-glucose 3-reductase
MGPVQFGIIACSSIARRRFLPALKLASGVQLARIGSRDAAKAEQFAREFGAPRHGTYEDVLADPHIKAVYISTPPSLHAEWVHKAAAAGKHVLCEKPAFSSGAEALKAVEACRAAGVRLMEGYVPKYHPQHARVRALLAEGLIGAPRFFEAEFTYPRPTGAKDIRLNPELLGGVLHDSAGYPVAAAMMHIPGRPVSVSCVQGRDSATGVDNACSMTLQFSGGEIANLYVAFGVQYRSRYAISGDAGRIELERAFAVAPDMSTTIALESNAGVMKIMVEPADQFRLMIEDFAAQISGGAEMKNYEADLLRMQTVMDAVAQSARERRTVEIKNL